MTADAFDPYHQEGTYEERVARLRALRDRAPVAASERGWFISGFSGVSAALRQPETFSGAFVDTSDVPPDEVSMLALREPQHSKVRRVVNSALAPHKTARLEPYIRELARDLLRMACAQTAGQTVELNEAYVDPIPSRAIARALGLPEADHDRFLKWSDDMVSDYAATPGAQFIAYIDEQIAARRRQIDPPDDVLTRLMRTEVDGDHLSDVAVRTHTMVLIAAGNETTRNLIANTLHHLSLDADLYARVRADRGLIAPLLDESLRLYPPVQIAGRNVWNDTEIDGCPLHAGDRAVLSYTAANRDPAAFDGPDEFRLDRANGRDHLSFGVGPRICPGATLARLEARVAIDEFANAVAAFSLADRYRFEPKPVFWAWGPERLEVRLTPC